MSTLATAPQGGAISVSRETIEDDFIILDPRSASGIAPAKTQERMNCLATISAGFRNGDGLPSRTQNGEIYVHGEAPYLQSVLDRNDGKALTVVFPSNNPKDFIQQRFAEYSKTQLLTYGDENSVTVIGKDGARHEFAAGTERYAAAIARCKVSVSVYFVLAEWVENGADIVFQDGLGLYRLRTTSINSLTSILFSVNHMRKTTGGVVAGIPFDLFLRKEEHADGKGMKRPCWIWQAVPRPPQGIRFDASRFRQFAEHGTQQMGMLQLTAPAPETIDRALEEARYIVDDDVIDAEAEFTSTPAPTAPEPRPEPEPAPAPQPTETVFNLDVREYQKRYFAIAAGSPYASDAGRHAFIGDFTGGVTTSLGEFLKTTRPDVADAMLTKLEALVKGEEVEEAPPAPTPATAQQRRAYADLQDRFTLIKAEPPKDLPGNISASSAAKWIARVQEDYDKKHAEYFAKTEAELGAKSASAPTADPELQPQTPLSQAVRDKAQAQPVDGEAEELFGGGDAYPPHIRQAMAAAYDAGFTHNGDLAYPPLIDAINANAKGLFLKTPITTLDGLPEMTASLITSFCETGRLKP